MKNCLLRSLELWKNIVDEYDIRPFDCAVIIDSCDREINELSIQLLCVVKDRRHVRRFIVLTHLEYVDEIVNRCFSDEICIVCVLDEDQIDDIIRLYGAKPFDGRLLINDTKSIFDTQPYALVGENGIRKIDILSICYFNIHDYDLNEINTACETSPLRRYKRIDWKNETVSDRYFGCSNELDIVNKLIADKSINRQRPIVFFGLSNALRRILPLLHDYSILAIVDNYSPQESFESIPILKPDKLFSACADDISVIVTSKDYKSICEQLYAYGYDYGKDVYVVHSSYVSQENDSLYLTTIIDEIKLGERVENALISQHGECHYIIEPFQGTGDLYYAFFYLVESAKSASDYVFITSNASCMRFADLLGFKTALLEKLELESLITYTRLTNNTERFRCINIQFRQDFAERLLGFNGVDFNTFLQRALYKNCNRVIPKELYASDASHLFDDYNLNEGKTVLLSPFANTVKGNDLSIWNEIAGMLLHLGYDVCTNIANEEEPISGTKGIFIDYKYLFDFVERAGFFISIRNGLCDILSQTKATMVILYPAEKIPFGDCYHLFSLKRMGVRLDNLFEYILDDNFNSRLLCSALNQMIP